MADDASSRGPDFGAGIDLSEVPDGGIVQGRVGDDDVILVRRGDALHAIGAHCTHYHAPLADGVLDGDTLRCPWHHARFSLRSGEALQAPALDPVGCWRVERSGDRAFVRERLAPPRRAAATTSAAAAPIVIVGGGAAGLAAADMLRREGYDGALTMLCADDAPPCDRPNLSKDYLAGTAPEDWIPLRSPDWYAERRIELVLGARADAIDVARRRVRLADGTERGYGSLLLATGADPVRLPIAGADDARIHTLRTLADSRAIVAAAASARRALVIGASFIGLEVAASLRTRGLAVDVVAPEAAPLARVLGAEVGRFIRELHEAQGVVFHLGCTVERIDGERATLSDGSTLAADLVVAGVGVRPALDLALRGGLAVDRGVLVNELLETSAPRVWAAGDIARWPDARTGELVRVEHWVVAQRQGQVAARNMLGARERFDAVPFFWSQHYDVAINYVGHAEHWDAIAIDGSLAARDCTVTYSRAGRRLAVATVSRDRDSLEAEIALESARS
jgi:NADPH-dependent 2,4-dienoyl-CoA reductase/sulfur reductase-like enzyme/nitrite reductase/ring-hydroxylating ferredoxin subunit